MCVFVDVKRPKEDRRLYSRTQYKIYFIQKRSFCREKMRPFYFDALGCGNNTHSQTDRVTFETLFRKEKRQRKLGILLLC